MRSLVCRRFECAFLQRLEDASWRAQTLSLEPKSLNPKPNTFVLQS